MRHRMVPPLPKSVLAPQLGDLEATRTTTCAELDPAISSRKEIIEWLHTTAQASRDYVKRALSRPEQFKPLDGFLMFSSLIRNGLHCCHNVQYVGDICFSKIGLFSPSPVLLESGIKVETTLTLSSVIVPVYDLVWCSATLGGTMTVSMVADETMGRDRETNKSLLNDTLSFLYTLAE